MLLVPAGAAATPELPQTPGSNVMMERCDLQGRNNAVESDFRVTPYKSALWATLSVDYANESAGSMSAVVFGVVSDGKLVAIGQDSGRFAPGAEIRHGWGGWIRTNAWRSQSPLPYRLATPHRLGVGSYIARTMRKGQARPSLSDDRARGDSRDFGGTTVRR
jgi:hypothetical protein